MVNAPQKISGRAEDRDYLGEEIGIPDPEIAEAATNGRSKRLRRILLLVVPVIVVVGAVLFYLSGGRYQSTDNAYVEAGIVNISANVPGRVIDIEVTENQHVKTGDVLFRLDPAPFQAAVDEAEAAVAAERLKVRATRANFHEGQSDLGAAEDRLKFAIRERERQRQLLSEGIASQAQYDRAALEAQQAQSAVEATQRQNQSILANLSGSVTTPIDEQPEVKRALAALESARLNLQYTVVRAPKDGVVTRVNQLQVGSFINTSQPVFALVGEKIWIEANFKEDQLTHMRLGQPVDIEVDAFPDLDLHGRVASFSPGTGSSFSVLPAENATGNWVKVVQRLPVQITIDRVPEGVPLHAGLSADVTVDTGYERHLFGPETQVQPAAP